MSSYIIPYNIDRPLDFPCYYFRSGFAVHCSKKFAPRKGDSDYIVGPVSCLSNTTHFLYLVEADTDMSILPLGCKAISDGAIPIPVGDAMPYPTFKEQVEMILNGASITVGWNNDFSFSSTQCGYQGRLCKSTEITINGSMRTVNWCNYQPGIAHNCSRCEQQGRRCGFSFMTNQTFCMHHSSRIKVISATSAAAALVVILLMVAAALYLSLKSRYNEDIHLKVKISRRFKEKVGQGAYGSVYKGMLPNGVPVAVKMIENSTGEGDEFINEVATIGLIHHANIVRLLGFCSEGTRRTLIYEFMPNDSLEKYIFLHASGASQELLPHNILLDYNFNPKISDFGLAKLCARDQSIVTMTAARGTMGYIAPELYSRNFGGVSHKSDVYSFGMLVLEMVSGRRNSDPSVDSQNEVYLPEWIFEKVITGQDMVFAREITAEEKEKVRKLAIVALWCIQWNPRNRPSMTRVVNMLTGSLENLQMPPKPFVSSENHDRP
ncbi:hypothetical protein HU200_036295 [Digitaria exilis]|uniref:Protein kinase domain-containing protein n=1 Tax=Digitaria exilis TaxID=1010633 RepID=A0A835EK39_9POAL|nr:hypothetical protein HU200_036295 [Digitaria exilis]